MKKKAFLQRSLFLAKTLCTGAIILTGGSQLTAQEGEVLELKELVVTGSYIPTEAGESFASPVTFVLSQNLKETGVGTSLLESLRKSVPQFSGSANLGMTNADIFSNSTGGGSQISLRNSSTLVLLNGRRVAFSPITGSGGRQFVDINLIPMSAVDRVEVLKDGASAIYGADATAGVVNIILKDQYEGFEVNGRFGQSSNEGNWQEHRVGFMMGTRAGNTSVSIAGEWSETDPLWLRDRLFDGPIYLTTSFAGVLLDTSNFTDYYVLNPEYGSAPPAGGASFADLVAQGVYNGPFSFGDLYSGTGAAAPHAFATSDHVTLGLSNNRKSVLANIEHDFSSTLTLFSEILYTENKTFSQINAQPFGSYVPADHPYNPLNEQAYAYNRFVEAPRKNYYDTESLRTVVGLRGDITDSLRFETAVNYNKIRQDYRRPGVIGWMALYDAAGLWPVAAPGSTPLVNIFARDQAAGALEASGAVGTASSRFNSKLFTVDARVFGSLAQIYSGEVKFAAGMEYRKEELDGAGDPNSNPDAVGGLGWLGAVSIRPFDRDRDVRSAFVEVRVPLVGPEQKVTAVDSLDVSLALRHERYSDTSNPTVPKISLLWQPVKNQLLVRATYSESFNAPGLYSMFGPSASGASQTISLVPAGSPGGTPPVLWGQANSLSGSNPNLKPSESESWTVGFVWSPRNVSGFSMEVDFFHIRETGVVSSIPAGVIAQDVETYGPDSVYASYLRLNGFEGPQVTAPGQVYSALSTDVYISTQAVNIAQRDLRGVDMAFNYDIEFSEQTVLRVSSIWAIVERFKVRTDALAAEFETAGRATGYNGTIPEWRTYNTVSLDWNSFNFFGGYSYIPSMPYDGGTRDMGSFESFDFAVAYSFAEQSALSGLSVRVGVNNAFNEKPPLAPELYLDANVDPSTYDPIGRLFFVEAGYKF